MVVAYVLVRQTVSVAANRQKVYHDEDTAMPFFKPSNLCLYWNKPKSQQTLFSSWTDPYLVVEKMSPVHYLIQFAPDGKRRTAHSGELQMTSCDQYRPNWIKDELTHCLTLASSDSEGCILYHSCSQLIVNCLVYTWRSLSLLILHLGNVDYYLVGCYKDNK